MKRYGRAARTLFSLATGIYALGVIAFVLARLILADRIHLLSFAADFTPWYFAPLIILFPLALILRAKRGAMLMLPLVVIGMVLFGRWYVPRAENTVTTGSLHILNFNVLFRNPTLDTALQWSEDQDADVLLLQEFREDQDETRFLDRYPHWVRGEFGNIIFSRTPLENAGLVTAPGGNQFLRAEVLVNDQRIAVYNVHLPLPIYIPPGVPDNGSNPLWWLQVYDVRPRDRIIRDLLAQVQTETLPVIVAGDFNMSEFATIYPEITAQLTDSYREAGYGLGLSWPASPFFQRIPFALPLTRIDYIWHTDDLRTVRSWQGERSFGSDHVPMQSILTWGDA